MFIVRRVKAFALRQEGHVTLAYLILQDWRPHYVSMALLADSGRIHAAGL